MDLSHLYNQMNDAQQRINELQGELAGLDSFKAQVSSDSTAFEGQVQRKKSTIAKATGVVNMKAAEGYREKMDAALNNSFQDGVFQCFDGVTSQICAAMGQIDEEIRLLRQKIATLEDQVAYEKQQEARRVQEEQRRAQERRTQEMRAQNNR